MNRTLPEMLHCLKIQGNGGADISVLERQQARMKWQQEELQQQQQQSFYDGNELSMFSLLAQAQQFQGLMGNVPNLDDFMNRVVKPDPGMENGWPDFVKFDGGDNDHLGYGSTRGYGNVSGFNTNHTLLRMESCPPAVAAVMAETAVSDVIENIQANSSSVSGRENSKKRKADKNQNLELVSEEEKRIKGCSKEEDSKMTHPNSNKNNKSTGNENNNDSNSRENSTDASSSKEKYKVSEVQKPDYIHVRARRGQATDSHSLAERVRREKISERMKYLQDLVPGCNKITGKAGMLDEIINYVQSLQRQVEFLSMKLAAVNPRLDFNIDNFFTKEMFPSDFPAIGVSSEMPNPAYFQLNPLQQMISCCGLEMGINPTEMALRRTISAPVSIPETFIDSSCFNQIQPPTTWDATEITNLYGMEFQQGRSTTFASQQFTGSNEGGNLKMEM